MYYASTLSRKYFCNSILLQINIMNFKVNQTNGFDVGNIPGDPKVSLPMSTENTMQRNKYIGVFN